MLVHTIDAILGQRHYTTPAASILTTCPDCRRQGVPRPLVDVVTDHGDDYACPDCRISWGYRHPSNGA